MKKSVLVATAFTVLMTNSAFADWGYVGDEDAFSEEVTHLAVAAQAGYGFGFRCTNADDLVLIYMTPEASKAEYADVMSAVSPKILVRVDKEAAAEFPAEMEENSSGNLSTIAYKGDIASLARSVAGANSRVAVAIELMGERWHVVDLNVSGSTNAVTQLLEGCAIPLDNAALPN